MNNDETQTESTPISPDSSVMNPELPVVENISVTENVEEVALAASETEVTEITEAATIEDETEIPVAKAESVEESNSLTPAQEENDAADEQEILAKIADLRKSIDEQIRDLDENYSVSEKFQDKRERLLAVQEEFKDWVGARRASYAWKLTDKLRGYQTSLGKDETEIHEFVAEEENLEFGFSEKTRKWFMKRFMINFCITWGLLIPLYLLHRYSAQISEWVFQNVSNVSLRDALASLIENLIGPGFWRIAIYILLASLAHFIGMLFAYSRRMSEYSRHVAVEAARTRAMDQGIHAVREARERIDSLHPQIPQILELLSLGLHQPWKLREEDIAFTASLPDASLMPASVEISVPTIAKASPIYEELVFKTMNEIQIPGWRANAFSSVMERISQSLGFGQNGLALRELDEDQRRSGKRELVLKAASVDKPFHEIGSELLEKFTAATQEKIIPTVQPEVVSLKPDPLANLDLSGTLLPEDSEFKAKWEEKLSEIAGHAAPWSSGTFSIAGASAKKHETLESIFLASERVHALAADEVEAHAEVHPGSRPFEVSIRVDLSQWCKPFEVAIFEDYQPSSEQLQRWDRVQNQSSINVSESDIQPDEGGILL
jgi:hypothetical protein